MPNITKQQAINRWDKLPMILREAIFSERNADILWGVCETQHLSDDKIYKVATLAGDVLLGFIHSEDFEKEIKQELGLNPEIAKIIAQEIERKIFSPIKSEIDKAYMLPLTEEEETEETEEAEEPVITDIRKEEVKITREAKYSKPGGVVGEAEPLKIIATEGIEKVVIPEAVKEEMKEAAPAPSVPEGPAVLYQEKEVAPALGDTSKKSLGDLFGFLNGKETVVKKEAPQIVAGVEMGNADLQTQQESVKQEEPKERLVHYSELKTPLSPLGEPIEKPAAAEEQKPAAEAAEPKKAIKPFELIKSVFKEIKPTVKVVDFIEEKPAEEVLTEIKKEEAKDEKTEIKAEAPKVIAEEAKEEEIPKEEIPKKESLFGKLFRFKKEKKEQIAAEKAPAEISAVEEIKPPEVSAEAFAEVKSGEQISANEEKTEKIEKNEEITEQKTEKKAGEKKSFFSKISGFLKKQNKEEIADEKSEMIVEERAVEEKEKSEEKQAENN